MARYENRTCHVCGAKYRFCPSCDADIHKPIWMIMFDNDECKLIFDTLTEYFYGRKTKEEVKADLADIQLKDFDEYEVPIANQLHEIFDEEPIEEDKFEDHKYKKN